MVLGGFGRSVEGGAAQLPCPTADDGLHKTAAAVESDGHARHPEPSQRSQIG